MTVKDLKEKLNDFPDDAIVYVPCEEYACYPHTIGRADSVTDFLPSGTVSDSDPDPRIMIF